ncbi:hypothetical protein GJAV_G00272960 [Gymnothorax javanicus]|nr:hypothetical protein GJAV_G00272960 [Gymnothorax javanicus]
MEDEEEGEEPDGENMQQSLGGGTVADVPATRGRSNDPLFPHCVGLRKDIVERKNQNNIITNPLSDANEAGSLRGKQPLKCKMWEPGFRPHPHLKT